MNMDTCLQPADPGDCITARSHGYRGILCSAFADPLYIFPIPEQGWLVVPFANVKEPKTAHAIFFTKEMERVTIPTLTAVSEEDVLAKAFEHYALPLEKRRENDRDERWPLGCEHGFSLGVHYFRFKAEDSILYVFPPTPKEPEATLLVFVQPPHDGQALFLAHLIHLDRNRAQQEWLEASSLDHLFERFLQHFREKTIYHFQKQQTRQHITTVLAFLVILASQVIIASIIWLLGTSLAHTIGERILLFLLVSLSGLFGSLVALRPLRLPKRSINRDRNRAIRHQLVLSGGIFLLEAGSLIYEIQAQVGMLRLPEAISLPAWFLLVLFLAFPFALGWHLGHYRPFSAYPHTYAPRQRPSIAIALAQSWLLKCLQQLRGYPTTIGASELPSRSAPLLLARDYLHTYRLGSSRMAPSSCRIRVFLPEWYDLPAPEPPVTLILCSVIPPGDITSSATTIANEIWHKEGTPRSLVWVEHWWPTHTPAEFRCIHFHCNQKGILDRPEWFSVERSALKAILKEDIEPLLDPMSGKHRPDGNKRSK